MLSLLGKAKTALLIEYCVERFGMSEKIFEEYKLYEGSKKKIYLIKKLINLRFVPESSGLCIFRFDKTPKPTTNFLQLFGSKIKRNILYKLIFNGNSKFYFHPLCYNVISFIITNISILQL